MERRPGVPLATRDGGLVLFGNPSGVMLPNWYAGGGRDLLLISFHLNSLSLACPRLTRPPRCGPLRMYLLASRGHASTDQPYDLKFFSHVIRSFPIYLSFMSPVLVYSPEILMRKDGCATRSRFRIISKKDNFAHARSDR